MKKITISFKIHKQDKGLIVHSVRTLLSQLNYRLYEIKTTKKRKTKRKAAGRLRMAKALQKQWPDIATIVKKWNRPQHKVDYSSFKANQLILKKGLHIPEGIDNYGMELIHFNENKSIFNYEK